MTTDIFANRDVAILAVTETNVHIQTEDGKGVMTLTAADIGGGGSGTSADIGTKADSAASTDAGTFSLIALFKRSLQKLTALVSTQTISLNGNPQVIDILETSTASSVFNAGTSRIILNSTVDCWVAIGATPIATDTDGSFFQSAGIPSYPISVTGGTDKVAVLRVLGNGSLSIIELV